MLDYHIIKKTHYNANRKHKRNNIETGDTQKIALKNILETQKEITLKHKLKIQKEMALNTQRK